MVINARSKATNQEKKCEPPMHGYALGGVQILQRKLFYYEEELASEWRAVRQDMIGGAKMKVGSIHAFLKHSIRFVRVRGVRKRTNRSYTDTHREIKEAI